MKKCPKCDDYKPTTEFAKNSSKPDGLQSQCRACKKINDARHYAANKLSQLERNKKNRELCFSEISEYKSKHGCKNCGEKTSCCLDFHHPNDNKDGDVSDLANAGCRNKMWVEIEKCIIVCANCHRKIHAGILQLRD